MKVHLRSTLPCENRRCHSLREIDIVEMALAGVVLPCVYVAARNGNCKFLLK